MYLLYLDGSGSVRNPNERLQDSNRFMPLPGLHVSRLGMKTPFGA